MLDKDKEKRLRAVKIAKAINSIEGKITDEQLTSAMLSICTKV